MDFTLSAYKQLVLALQAQGYFFQTFEEYIKQPKVKVVILRHDVDRLPSNALVIAKIEKEAGIRASYYFRIVKESYDEDVIRQIAEMGHEIGYHYENLSDPQITQIDADCLISHSRTQTDTDICPADIAGQKMSSLRREKTEISRLRTRRTSALSRQEAASCQGGRRTEEGIRWCGSQSFVILLPCTGEEKAA